MSLFQSNLRKQIRNLPKILNFVKKIHYYSELFTSLLSPTSRLMPGKSRRLQSGVKTEAPAKRIRFSFFMGTSGEPMLARTQLSNYLNLKGSFSVVSKPNFASKYALESSRRDLQNALLCTVLVESVWVKNIRK